MLSQGGVVLASVNFRFADDSRRSLLQPGWSLCAINRQRYRASGCLEGGKGEVVSPEQFESNGPRPLPRRNDLRPSARLRRSRRADLLLRSPLRPSRRDQCRRLGAVCSKPNSLLRLRGRTSRTAEIGPIATVQGNRQIATALLANSHQFKRGWSLNRVGRILQ